MARYEEARIYAERSDGEVVFATSVSCYHGSEAWRPLVVDKIREIRKQGLIARVLLPQYISGVARSLTPQELDYERSRGIVQHAVGDDLLTDTIVSSPTRPPREVPFTREPELGYPQTFEVPSSTDASQKYIVVVTSSQGTGTCTCRGFSYRRRCRHLDSKLKELGLRD